LAARQQGCRQHQAFEHRFHSVAPELKFYGFSSTQALWCGAFWFAAKIVYSVSFDAFSKSCANVFEKPKNPRRLHGMQSNSGDVCAHWSLLQGRDKLALQSAFTFAVFF